MVRELFSLKPAVNCAAVTDSKRVHLRWPWSRFHSSPSCRLRETTASSVVGFLYQSFSLRAVHRSDAKETLKAGLKRQNPYSIYEHSYFNTQIKKILLQGELPEFNPRSGSWGLAHPWWSVPLEKQFPFLLVTLSLSIELVFLTKSRRLVLGQTSMITQFWWVFSDFCVCAVSKHRLLWFKWISFLLQRSSLVLISCTSWCHLFFTGSFNDGSSVSGLCCGSMFLQTLQRHRSLTAAGQAQVQVCEWDVWGGYHHALALHGSNALSLSAPVRHQSLNGLLTEALRAQNKSVLRCKRECYYNRYICDKVGCLTCSVTVTRTRAHRLMKIFRTWLQASETSICL